MFDFLKIKKSNNNEIATEPKSISETETKTEIFDLAISFNGKHRNEAEEIYNVLSENYNVYMDNKHEKKIKFAEYLSKVFKKSNYIIVLLSEEYEKGEWTVHEKQFIIDNAVKNKWNNIFIIKYDNFDYNWIAENSHYIYYRGKHNSIKDIINDININMKRMNTNNYIGNNELSSNNNISQILYEKIFLIFQFHEINKVEIPLLLYKDYTIDYCDLDGKHIFCKKITPELIVFLSEYFKINIQWFYNNRRYFIDNDYNSFYKNVKLFGDKIVKENVDKLYILLEETPNIEKNEKDDSNYFVIISKTGIGTYPIVDKEIFQYKVYDDTCRWGYRKCRYNLKSFLLYLKEYNQSCVFVDGRVVENLLDKVEQFKMGKVSFTQLSSGKIWYPDDYICTEQQSVQAKEPEELENILSSIKKDKWSFF